MSSHSFPLIKCNCWKRFSEIFQFSLKIKYFRFSSHKIFELIIYTFLYLIYLSFRFKSFVKYRGLAISEFLRRVENFKFAGLDTVFKIS